MPDRSGPPFVSPSDLPGPRPPPPDRPARHGRKDRERARDCSGLGRSCARNRAMVGDLRARVRCRDFEATSIARARRADAAASASASARDRCPETEDGYSPPVDEGRAGVRRRGGQGRTPTRRRRACNGHELAHAVATNGRVRIDSSLAKRTDERSARRWRRGVRGARAPAAARAQGARKRGEGAAGRRRDVGRPVAKKSRPLGGLFSRAPSRCDRNAHLLLSPSTPSSKVRSAISALGARARAPSGPFGIGCARRCSVAARAKGQEAKSEAKGGDAAKAPATRDRSQGEASRRLRKAETVAAVLGRKVGRGSGTWAGVARPEPRLCAALRGELAGRNGRAGGRPWARGKGDRSVGAFVAVETQERLEIEGKQNKNKRKRGGQNARTTVPCTECELRTNKNET